jgi:uncharacterized protein (DUF1501 family)
METGKGMKGRGDWWSCDGNGFLRPKTTREAQPPHETRESVSRLSPTRRQALIGAALALVGWAAKDSTALADLTITPGKPAEQADTLVVIFLRGGADGLNIVIPYMEDDYHRSRQNIGIAAPNDRRAAAADRAIDLDGFFGMHPAMAPLRSLYEQGLLAFVHACGSGDQTRSHFEAMATMERGLPDEKTGLASGWMARYLSHTDNGNPSPLRAVSFSSVMPDSLRGATDATALTSLNEFRLVLPSGGGPEKEAILRAALESLYREGKDAVSYAGRETLAVLQTLNRINPDNYRPAGGAIYPDSELGKGMRQVACLIKGKVGLEVACLERGGWDTHVAQGSSGGWLASNLDDVSRSLAAFAADMGAQMSRISVVVMTEFGRRLVENGGLGTDHGRASVMWLLGGGIAGGKVYARWPTLAKDQLEEGLDLQVTTDYRDVLAEIVTRRLLNSRAAAIFPNYTPKPLGVAKIKA